MHDAALTAHTDLHAAVGPAFDVALGASRALAEAMAQVLPALTAARAAHEAVVDASIDLIALTRQGQREHTFRHHMAHFDAAVVALGLAALEHLPIDWGQPAAGALPLSGVPSFLGTADTSGGPSLAEGGPSLSAAAEEVGGPSFVEGGPSFSGTVEAGASAPVPRPASDGPVDVRHAWSDPDEDSVVDWPVEDPGPVGSGRSMRPGRQPVPLERLEALKAHLASGGGALAAEATPVPVSPLAGAIAALRRLGPAPVSITTMEEMSKEYGCLQSCADPARLETIGHLPAMSCALVAEYLNARLHRIWREVPHRLRPHHILGENAWRTLQMAIDRFHLAQRRQVARLEPLKPAPRQRSWLADAVALEPQVHAIIEAASARPPESATNSAAPTIEVSPPVHDSGGASSTSCTHLLAPGPGSSPPLAPFNIERALDGLERALGDGASIEVLAPQVLALLKGGMTADDKRLNAVLAERIAEFTAPGFKTLRAKTRRFLRDQVPEVDVGTEVWPEAAALAGQRVILVGGDRQATALERLRVRLSGVDVEWVETSPGGGVRQVQAARTRIGQGSVDVLLLIQRFISHKVSDCLVDEQKTCGHNVRLEVVRRGYGLAQIRRALQGCLSAAG